MAKIEKLVSLAKDHLESGEQVIHAVLGQYETKILNTETTRKGVLIATDRRVIFFAKKLTGYDLEVFPYSNISSIEASKGLMGHSISLFSSGNKVKIKWIQEENKGDMQKFINYVKENIGKKSGGQTNNDVIDQIKKLAELKESGIISEEEFKNKKEDLLSKI